MSRATSRHADAIAAIRDRMNGPPATGQATDTAANGDAVDDAVRRIDLFLRNRDQRQLSLF